jgi:thiol-disulfide isomerase/thioredoxin
MISNLTGQQILLIIIGIIIVIWLIGWLMSSHNKPALPIQQQIVRQPAQIITPQIITPQIITPQPPTMPHPTQPSITKPLGPEVQHETPFTLYYFYRPTCPYCKQFEPIWKEIVNHFKNINGISLRAVDSTLPQNENLSFYYNITSVPTIILVTPEKNIEYEGNRSSNDLYNFVISHINDYLQNNQNNQYAPNDNYDINNQYD